MQEGVLFKINASLNFLSRLRHVLRLLFLPVVGGIPLVGDGGVVHALWVEPLELPVVVVPHVVPHVLGLGPVDVSSLGSKPGE